MKSAGTALHVSRSDLVYLVSAEEKGSKRMAWYYVLIKNKAKLPIFLKKVKTGLNLNDYGKVLYSGWGKEPPEEIKKKIKEQFG